MDPAMASIRAIERGPSQVRLRAASELRVLCEQAGVAVDAGATFIVVRATNRASVDGSP